MDCDVKPGVKLRRLALALFSGAALACSDSGPEPSSVEGIWQLRTVNGQR